MDGLSAFIDEATIERAQKARDNGTKLPVDAQWLGGTYSENRKPGTKHRLCRG